MLLKPLIHSGMIVFLLLGHAQSKGQVAEITPEKPKWGDTLQVIYNPTTESAKLLPGDEIYTVYFVFFADASEKRWGKMQKNGSIFKYEMTVEENMAFLTFYFITLEDWDREATVSTMVYRRDGVPARGAYLEKMTSPYLTENYLEFFQKEIELYPDNYATYRNKWFVQGAFDPDNLTKVIKQDIAMLKKQVKNEPVDFLYSLSYGYMLLGDEEQSRDILQKMVQKYPESFYMGWAIENYEYQVFSKQIKGEGPKQVEKMKWELIQKYPKTRYSREKSVYLAEEKEVPLASVEAICEPWMKDEPDNPMPYFSLAYAYSERKQKLNRAADLIERAIDLLLQGKLRLYEDVSGKMTEIYLPSYLETASDIQFHLGRYANALVYTQTAQRIIRKEPRPRYHEREATIWLRVGSYSKAESSFLEALRLGSKIARDSLKAIYFKRRETMDGFEEYLAEKTQKQRIEPSEEKQRAPNFEVTTLDGKSLRLIDLKGKVVVINFWYIGCAPCRVEIPGLNQLTEEFKEAQIVFIAFALDDEKDLKSFLEKTPFEYQIVPNAGEIAKRFSVKVYPTHIIIDKEGAIEFTLTGGSPTRHEQLKPLIIDTLR